MNHVIEEIQSLHEKILDLEAMRESMTVESLNDLPPVDPFAAMLDEYRSRMAELERQFNEEMA